MVSALNLLLCLMIDASHCHMEADKVDRTLLHWYHGHIDVNMWVKAEGFLEIVHGFYP